MRGYANVQMNNLLNFILKPQHHVGVLFFIGYYEQTRRFYADGY